MAAWQLNGGVPMSDSRSHAVGLGPGFPQVVSSAVMPAVVTAAIVSGENGEPKTRRRGQRRKQCLASHPI